MITKGVARDTVIGAMVVACAAVFLGLVYLKEDLRAKTSEGYTVIARFNRLDGISVGSPVRLSGVNIGAVVGEVLDADFRAVTSLQISDGVALPVDSSAVIRTDGLLGAKYIELGPGGDDVMLKDGDSIKYTQDSMVIEDLLDLIIKRGKEKRGFTATPLPSVSNN